MATPEEIRNKNIQESNEALAESLDLASQLNDKMTFLYKTSKDKFTQDKLALDLTKQAVALTKALSSEYTSVKDVEKDIAKNKKLQNEIARTSINLEKEIGEQGKKRVQFIKNQEKGLSRSKDLLKELREKEVLGVKGAKEQADQLSRQIMSRQKSLVTQQQNLSMEERQYMLLQDTSKTLEQNNQHLAEQLNRQNNLVKSSSLFTSALGGANKALSKLGFGNLAQKLGLDAASKKAQEMTYTLTEGGKRSLGMFGKMRVGIASFGAALKSALGPLALIGMATSLFQKFKEKGQEALSVQREYNQQMVDMQRSLGVSTSVASKLYSQTQGVGRAMGLTADQAAAAGTAIYGQLNGVEKLSNKTIGLFMKMNAHGGVTAETLGKIYELSKLTGEEAADVANNIAKQSQQSIKSLKLNVSMKAIMDGVANTSNRLKISLGGSAVEITKSVAQAKKLGLEMNQVESIMDSMLNIEDSLAAEMEAELLTGKDLNLEKARTAALNNDAKGFAEAMTEQGITQSEFGNMNRIQQEAIAKAMGMSASDMADMLNNSAKNKSENQQLLDAQKEGAKAMMGAASAMEAFAQAQKDAAIAAAGTGTTFAKYEEAMMKLQKAMGPILDAILVPIGEVVTGIVEKVADWLSDTKNVEMITKGIKGLFSTISQIAGIIWTIIQPIVKSLWGLFESALPGIVNLFEGLKPILTFIGKMVAGMVDSISKFFGFLTQTKDMAIVAGGAFLTMLGYQKAMTAVKAKNLVLEEGSKKVTLRTLAIEKAKAIQEKATQALKKAGFMQENAFSMKSIFKNIANLAVSAAKAVAGIPFVGPVLAAAAAAGAYMLGKKMLSQADGEGSKADDMFSGGGYGKRTLMGPEGAIKLNDKDDIIAGTDLFGKGKKGENAVSGGDGAVVAELQRVSSLLQQLLAKEGTVVMDGQKIGQALVLGSYKTQ